MIPHRFEQEALPQMSALLGFALQLCRDEQHSRDLVQETMLKAYLYFHTYQEGTNCRAWLFQICKNSFINETRRKQHQPVAIDFQQVESGDWPSGDDNTHRDVQVKMSHQHPGNTVTDALGDEVYHAIEMLPSDYQTVLILCDIEGHTYEEIAGFMQTPVGTVRSRIHRGRKLLAGQLINYARARGYSSQSSSANN
jgi:RNA polymerase sigma factor (sigma-70 family)